MSCFPCSRHSTHPGRLTTKHILPHVPVCLGSTCDRGSGVEDGVTTLPSISIAVSNALDSKDCAAASILAERTIRDDGIAISIIIVLKDQPLTLCPPKRVEQSNGEDLTVYLLSERLCEC